MSISLALYHPQIPQNTGTLLRLSSCLGVHVDLIRPFGFVFNDKKMRRAGMDYIETANFTIHNSFNEFKKYYTDRRVIAMEANSAEYSHNEFKYEDGDVLIVGSEHYGFLSDDLNNIGYRVKIPMIPNRRSMNMAIAASIVLSEAMSQLKMFPSF